jgi:hypothetical protein
MVQGSPARWDRAGERGSGGDWLEMYGRYLRRREGSHHQIARYDHCDHLAWSGGPPQSPTQRKVVSGHAYAIPAPPVVRLGVRKTNTDYPPGR